jgi:hypothetical protein
MLTNYKKKITGTIFQPKYSVPVPVLVLNLSFPNTFCDHYLKIITAFFLNYLLLTGTKMELDLIPDIRIMPKKDQESRHF